MDYNESPLYSPPKPEDCIATGVGFGVFIFTLLFILGYIILT